MDEEPTYSRPVKNGPGTKEAAKKATDGGWTFVTQAQYDPNESLELTTVIISAIAEAEGVPKTEILSPPLYEVVDTAAIERALYGRQSGSENGTDSTVEFRYNGYKVSVEADGWVSVSRPDEESASDGS